MLRRSMNLLHATALVVGIIIGASIFVQPSVISAAMPSARAVMVVWAGSGILTLCGALIAAELASAYPLAGGVYSFLNEAYSPALGFLWGWAMFWTMHTGIIAAIAVVFARYVAFFVPLGVGGLEAAAITAIVALSAVNYVGVRQGSFVQTVLTIVKVVAIVAIIVVGVVITPRRVPASSAGVTAPPVLTAGGFGVGLAAGLFAFGGWHMVTYAAEETAEPERTIPRALLIGTLLVTACYMALNAVYFHILPLSVVIASKNVAADAADAVLGSGGAAIMSVVVIVSTLGGLGGVILAGPRAYLAMARDRMLFSWVGAVHPEYGTPHRAIVLQGAWASVLVATGTYRSLFSRVVFTEWLFFALMALGLMALRRRPGYAPAYRVWGYPIVPLVFAAASLYVVASQIIAQPGESAIGLLLVGAGWPIYYFWLRRSPPTPVTTHGD